MPLTAGTRLAPYEILSPLGAGGMEERSQCHLEPEPSQYLHAVRRGHDVNGTDYLVTERVLKR